MIDRFTVSQNLYKGQQTEIAVERVGLGDLSETTIKSFIATAPSDIGMAASYDNKFAIDALAFSTTSHVLIITTGNGTRQKSQGKTILSDMILCHPSYKKHGFDMDRIASALHLDLNLSIQNAFDIQHTKLPRHSSAMILNILSQDGALTLNRPAVLATVDKQKSARAPKERLPLRAWACVKAYSRSRVVKAIDTKSIDREVLNFLAQCVRDADRLDNLKPSAIQNDISTNVEIKKGVVHLESTRFKTRLRPSHGVQTIEFETSRGKIPARTVGVKGKSAKLAVSRKVEAGSILSVTTYGKVPTGAEVERSTIVLEALQGTTHIHTSPFVRKIFLPNYPIAWPTFQGSAPGVYFPHCVLNKSQQRAVELCLCRSDANRVALIVGPPGTGKTTVIAACVSSIISGTSMDTVWLVAQSNVAVKNIAEKLADCRFLDFRLIVSNEFHFEWHEHLYREIEQNVIKSDDFANIIETERMIGNSRVMLCTISMLSNTRLHESGFFKVVPFQTVIVDEASQLEIGDYLPMFSRFKSSLRKVVFTGDDKQLAPFGQEEIKDLRSVFELSHLRNNETFLDTQYRLPKPIGDFISRNVYQGKLATCHKILSHSCCRFVDVSTGVETRQKGSTSWINQEEVKMITSIARRYIKEKKRFRIITPYDAQRNAIENALKTAGLKWGDTCYTVDSFQGHEADHIIVSIVRSSGPGFLTNKRRMNVMLTRCKQSMLICTSRTLLQDQRVKSTLVGLLAKQCVGNSGAGAWIDMQQIKKGMW